MVLFFRLFLFCLFSGAHLRPGVMSHLDSGGCMMFGKHVNMGTSTHITDPCMYGLSKQKLIRNNVDHLVSRDGSVWKRY